VIIISTWSMSTDAGTAKEATQGHRKGLMPIPPSPHRTTSQLSVVSVSASHSDVGTPRELLSQRLHRPGNAKRRSLPHVTDPNCCDSEDASESVGYSKASSSRVTLDNEDTHFDIEGRSQQSSSSHSSTSKGKEKANDQDVEPIVQITQGEVEGEMVAGVKDGGVVTGLRELVRRSTGLSELRRDHSGVTSRASSIRGEYDCIVIRTCRR
jgi:hypothetical protein